MEATTKPLPVVQVCVDLPSDLHRRLKITAVTIGASMKDCVTGAINEWLDLHSEA